MVEISCIICAWNRLDLLERCLISLSRQTFKNFEVILIDDDSTENVYSLYRKYINKLNLVFIQLNNRKGHISWSIPFNMGIKIAKSNFIMRLGSEIIIQKDAIENLVNDLKIDNENDKKAYFGYCYDINTAEKLSKIDTVNWLENMKSLEDLSIKLYHHATYWVTPYIMGIRKKWLNDIGGADEKIIGGPDDSDLWMRLMATGVTQVNDGSIIGAHQYHEWQAVNTGNGYDYVWKMDGWKPDMPLVYKGKKENIVRNK